MTEPTHTAASDQQVLITRIFDAPREQVFAAWTDPDQVAAWYGPQHFDTPRETVLIEPRVGGRYELTMVEHGTGREHPVRYEIVELVEPELRGNCHARGVPRPRRQDARDPRRRPVPRERARRGRVERSRFRQARRARRRVGMATRLTDPG
jgi:hypothetical protein